MLKEKKTYKDDMLVGDLVENREFDVNCNFEIYDCTEKGSDWQKGAKKIFSTINEAGSSMDGRPRPTLGCFEGCWTCTGSQKPRPRSALRLRRRLSACGLGEGERKFANHPNDKILAMRVQYIALDIERKALVIEVGKIA